MKMTIRTSCATLICLLFLSPLPVYAFTGNPYSSGNPLTLLVKNEGPSTPGEDLSEDSLLSVQDYEKEKLAGLKRNIGRRLLTVRTLHPAEFYESPDDLGKRVRVKNEKEGFVIVEVVQNQSGTMNFYQVKFDTGQTGYLSADGKYLEIKVKEGSLISVPRRAKARGGISNQSKASISRAIELVKNHPTPADPITGETKSVEKRMRDKKSDAFPNPRWRYEAREIGGNKFRVFQYVEERAAPPFARTWIVDLSTAAVKPENAAAREMYQ
jgi:hypothetical protein